MNLVHLEINRIEEILDKKTDRVQRGLLDLSEYLYAHFGVGSIILMDEYDSILNDAFRNLEKPDLEKTIILMQSIMEATFKDNIY
jgi:hypothetical protein